MLNPCSPSSSYCHTARLLELVQAQVKNSCRRLGVRSLKAAYNKQVLPVDGGGSSDSGWASEKEGRQIMTQERNTSTKLFNQSSGQRYERLGLLGLLPLNEAYTKAAALVYERPLQCRGMPNVVLVPLIYNDLCLRFVFFTIIFWYHACNTSQFDISSTITNYSEGRKTFTSDYS